MGLLSSLGTARAGSLVRAIAPDQHGGAAGGSMSLFSGNMGGGLGGHSRSLDLVMKQEAPDGPDVSKSSVYLPICSSHLILACVLLPHAYGFSLPFDACPAPLVTRA